MRRRRRRESERWGASARFFCVFCFADFRPFSFLASPPLRSHLSSNPFSFSSHQNLQPPLRNRNSYVDSSVIMGMTGGYKQDGTGFEGIEYMLCRPETEFFPDLAKVRVRFRFRFFFFRFGFFSLSRARASEKGEERVSLFFPSSPLSFSFRWLSFRTSAAYILEKAKEKKRSLARRKRESKWKILFLGSEEKTPRSQPLFLIPSSTLIKLFILILKNLTTEKNRQSAPTSSSSAPRTTPRAPRPPASSSLN